MTAKTHGYITKEIELEQIYQFVLKYFDPEAKVNRYENRFGESNEMAVYFTYKGEERRLFTMVYKSRKFSKNGEKNRLVFLDLDYCTAWKLCVPFCPISAAGWMKTTAIRRKHTLSRSSRTA
jgi:NAD-dependent dihydropyrimidine dehydrogenase PreA subunit